MKLNINWNTVKSIIRRDIRLYFSNPTGYVFITLFIFLSAFAAFWQDRFFLNNLANLDQLNKFFPYLLLFFIPALTMGVWADERRQGTDELLLTLPATDLEVVLGKFLATVGVYTVSLILSLSHVIVLFFLGNPDLGLMFGNYLGYWLFGMAFISVGMFASLLAPSATIAYILGALFCALFVFVDRIGAVGPFDDFARGVVSFSGLFYFLSLTAFMLYLNVLLLSRRHWPREAEGLDMSIHHSVRTLALIVALISVNVIFSRCSARLDVTAERLHSLSPETKRLLSEIPEDRPVFIQAYISKEVPQGYVQTRENLISFLKEIDAIGGDRVEVTIYDTELYSEEAREAREKFNILPREVLEQTATGSNVEQIFLGVAFTCGAEEQVIPFFERGLPVEYELVRSIRTVSKTDQKKIGVVVTEAKLFGGFDFNAGTTRPAWQVVDELKKQYEVVRISPAAPITEEVDALVVPMPSSLPQNEMDNLLKYIQTGVPTVLLVDPLPYVDLGIAPSERAGANRNPFMSQGQPPPKPKGDIHTFMRKLGVSWNKAQIVWDAYNPHPDFASMPPEIVFVGRGNQNPASINDTISVTSGLQELVFMFPGYLNRASGEDVQFIPLIKSGRVSGLQHYQAMVRRHFLFGPQLVLNGLRHRPNSVDYTLAAWVKSKRTVSSPDTTAGDTTAAATDTTRINAIVIADIDFISDAFFELRKQGPANLNFDNIPFFLNCVDMLVGDESFIELRKRRVKHRTLTRVEARIQEYIQKRAEEEQQAESEAQIALSEAQQRLDERVAEVRQRTDLDEQTKRIMVRTIQEAENRKFEAVKTSIEAQKNAKIAEIKERMEAQIRAIQNTIKTLAVVLPPIPVFVVGVMIFIRRRRREAEAAAAARRLRS